MGERDLVIVYRARNSLEAYLLKAPLEEAGINVVIEGQLLQGALGEIPLGWSTTLRIKVASQDAPRAREIISQNEKAALESRKGSSELDEGACVCLSCGGQLREEDETCPECGWSYKNGYSS